MTLSLPGTWEPRATCTVGLVSQSARVWSFLPFPWRRQSAPSRISKTCGSPPTERYFTQANLIKTILVRTRDLQTKNQSPCPRSFLRIGQWVPHQRKIQTLVHILKNNFYVQNKVNGPTFQRLPSLSWRRALAIARTARTRWTTTTRRFTAGQMRSPARIHQRTRPSTTLSQTRCSSTRSAMARRPDLSTLSTWTRKGLEDLPCQTALPARHIMS